MFTKEATCGLVVVDAPGCETPLGCRAGEGEGSSLAGEGRAEERGGGGGDRGQHLESGLGGGAQSGE